MTNPHEYIERRGLLPFWQRPEYCQCVNCIERRKLDELEMAKSGAAEAVKTWRTQ